MGIIGRLRAEGVRVNSTLVARVVHEVTGVQRKPGTFRQMERSGIPAWLMPRVGEVIARAREVVDARRVG